MQRSEPQTDPAPIPWWRRALRAAGAIALTLFAVAVIVAGWLYASARAVPEFYSQALEKKLEPIQAKAAADAVEKQVLNARNDVTRGTTWELALKADEINSWLTTELPTKMPKALPSTIKDPRVVIGDGAIRIGCKYEGGISGVLTLVLEPSLADQPNTLAIRLRCLNLGNLPLPRKMYLDEVTKAADKNKIPLRWSDEAGEPVAIVSIPSEHESFKARTLHLESLEVREGELVLRGRAEITK